MLKETEMLKTNTKTVGQAGFTLVELLTVMAIIALLIGLMVPALGHVKNTAKVVQQKAQLKSIESALEAFSATYGDYPPSAETSQSTPGWSSTTANSVTCGSQKLAEALLGVDLRGFDTKSDFDRYTIENSKEPYAVKDMPSGTLQVDVDNSISRRKGPYIAVTENVNSFEVADLFRTAAGAYTGVVYGGGAPGRDSAGAVAKKFGNVICDNFKVRNINYTTYDYSTSAAVTMTAKVGTPILYYKADASKKTLDPCDVTTSSTNTLDNKSIYNWNDNKALLEMGSLTGKIHYWLDTTNPARGTFTGVSGDAAAFYSYIQNPKINTGRWPFNADSYLLISAGPDSIYGTADDITNFGTMDQK
jgi:prepilin-type N-terminal cleavage/methylation domain-containing protein